ncbi:MAG: 4'-phosphopantetheinyl transferase superfamily protein [Candidatus Omnitrophica bacterium]|nr:4'-phosphopantetheinyl transferase superfamily protein [Candidatus Omnitrophota bacterium]MCM8827727.1 4'-phosphopantetheinyl transferase superfamily protein [Candidatus Omnitrophota bacterium]
MADSKAKIEAGIDILERERIKKAIISYGNSFLKRIFTQQEISSFPEKKELYFSIGFSLKEAFWKTLPSRIQKKTYFDDIEVIWKNNNPEIFLSGKKAKNIHTSLFFDEKVVMTSVMRQRKRTS